MHLQQTPSDIAIRGQPYVVNNHKQWLSTFNKLKSKHLGFVAFFMQHKQPLNSFWVSICQGQNRINIVAVRKASLANVYMIHIIKPLFMFSQVRSSFPSDVIQKFRFFLQAFLTDQTILGWRKFRVCVLLALAFFQQRIKSIFGCHYF